MWVDDNGGGRADLFRFMYKMGKKNDETINM